ncbi:TPA: hypothetical protein NJ265_003556 [Vibrio parahaemolyticus]|uniref:hypothetical protein n=1 Tax=Vibrio parahaemolyticus TaxID=670 RepID=UPI001120132E|nr:hypothetical protein [Vibrio parahaemolyticus]TOH02695.1 hypothetical protein CGI88_18600 [Vibrio parahaemolyticus]HCE1829003.1 hypothetical protein [Vibrio parahaemolyticus]HCE5183818.1 hypothetical protein [Vibrio parahaemolyticus]HCG5604927.1 hypothetical protein [Vibrio parahaemolyticus]HCG6435418.1 hypothetical protein [Vibrio parahaemolyticus]
MEFEFTLEQIKLVAQEQGYYIEDRGEKQFEVYFDNHNAVAFFVYGNGSSGYIEVSQWEAEAERFGRCVYSLRSYSDVAHFCNILVSSAAIRARRK